MSRLEYGTCVKVIKTGRIGMVDERERTNVTVEFYDRSMINPERITFKDHELAVEEIPNVKTSQLKPIVRGELSISEISNGVFLIPQYVDVDSEAYKITAEDLLTGLNAYEGRSVEEVYSWLDALFLFDDEMSFINDPWEDIVDEVTEKDVLNEAYGILDGLRWEIYNEEPNALDSENFKLVRETLEVWVKSNGTDCSDNIKQRVAFQFDNDSIDKQSEKTQILFKNCLDYFCDVKKDPKAIQKRGYCYYCGTKIYPNDWIKARDAFLEYYQMTGDASAANTLGYIYYYGRCNAGNPEYEEAFKYFSIGYAYTYFESTYKLADMFVHGYGVIKDGKTANHLYWSVYNQCYERFITGDVECEFADAALRIGNCYRDEIGEDKDSQLAYYYYLQADYAIRKRIKAANHYGDHVVYSGVQKALASVRAEYTKSVRTVKYDYPRWIKWCLIGHRRCKVNVKELKNGAFALDASPIKRYDEEKAPLMFVTIPKADYCELKKKIRIKTATDSIINMKSGKSEFIFDHVEYDWREHKTTYYLFEEIVAELITESYTFTVPAKARKTQIGKQYHLVSVIFEGTGRVYDYLCEDQTVTTGDFVVINGYDGEKTVEVVEVFDKYESELGIPIERYKSVIRKA